MVCDATRRASCPNRIRRPVHNSESNWIFMAPWQGQEVVLCQYISLLVSQIIISVIAKSIRQTCMANSSTHVRTWTSHHTGWLIMIVYGIALHATDYRSRHVCLIPFCYWCLACYLICTWNYSVLSNQSAHLGSITITLRHSILAGQSIVLNARTWINLSLLR